MAATPLPRLAVVAGLVATAVPALHAQADTGSISGRVLNAQTGQYVKNAVITVEGTDDLIITDEHGNYTIYDLPAGQATIKAYYTGLAAQTVTLDVTANGETKHDFQLAQEGATVEDDGTVRLDEFVVSTNKETNATLIASAEQRYSPNIKNVISADAFGDVAESNVGEFVKFLPGVTVNYVAADVRTISVRGFPDSFTAVTIDGARISNAASGSTIRTFELEQVSLNNVSRIELTKVARPEDAGDALGGTVNMITKSAFDRNKAAFNYRAYFNFSDEDTNFKKTPGPGNKSSYKMFPGFDFDYTLPVSDNLGFVVTGLTSNQFNEQHRSQPTWTTSAAGASVADPYLQKYQLQDGPKQTFRDSLSLRADWRFLQQHTLSLTTQANYYKSFFGNRNLTWNVGSKAPTSFDEDTTIGAATGGSVQMGTSFREKLGNTNLAILNYNFAGRDWQIDAGANVSHSRSWYRSGTHGHFSSITGVLQGVSQVTFDNISNPRPGTLQALNSSGVAIDPYTLSNYRITAAADQPQDATDKVHDFYVKVAHDFESLPFPLKVKVGADSREDQRDIRKLNNSYTFLGADGKANTADNIATPFLDTGYYNQDPHFGFTPPQWASPYLLWQSYETNPSYWSFDQAKSLINQITGSLAIDEKVDSAFAQFEAKFFHNKLTVLGGVRLEHTQDDGYGPLYNPNAVYQRNADGSYVTDSSGKPVRKTEAGAAGSVQEVMLTRSERGLHGTADYTNTLPSVHASYNLSEGLVLRAAFSESVGRPDYGSIVPTATVSTQDTTDLTATPTVTFTNPALKPYSARNYDVRAEYYFKKGGYVSAGFFYKQIDDVFGKTSFTLTSDLIDQYGLDSSLEGLKANTTINDGTAIIRGVEFSYLQPLDFLGDFGRHFDLQINASKLALTTALDSGTNALADFPGLIKETASAGLTFTWKPVVLKVNYNYRGRQQNSISGSQTQYYAPRYNVDVNAEYEFSKHFALFANARNILNKSQDLQLYADGQPSYSYLNRREEFAVQWTIGVKGTF